MMSETPQPPGHPFTPAQVRMLRMAVIIMGVLIVLGLIALVYGIARQARKMAEVRDTPTRVEAPFSRPLNIGRGRVQSMVLNDGTLAIHVSDGDAGGTAERGEIIIFDIRRGREIGRIPLRTGE